MTQNPLILAVETSSRVGSVAIAAGQKLLLEAWLSGPMKHSAELFPAIGNLLDSFGREPKEIEHVYISVGPGSFTGLRIAVTLAKTMHLANSAKIVTVDTLDVIAANVINLCRSPRAMSNEGRATSDKPHIPSIEHRVSSISTGRLSAETVAPLLDAKRNQFYTAIYQRTSDAIWDKIVPDCLMTADEFLNRFADKENPVWLLGDGLLYHKEKFKAEGICFFDQKFWSPRASKVHQLGWQLALANQFADPLLLTPNYLMRPDIKLKKR